MGPLVAETQCSAPKIATAFCHGHFVSSPNQHTFSLAWLQTTSSMEEEMRNTDDKIRNINPFGFIQPTSSSVPPPFSFFFFLLAPTILALPTTPIITRHLISTGVALAGISGRHVCVRHRRSRTPLCHPQRRRLTERLDACNAMSV